MRKIVFIASLSHSGSTLLDLILGGHSRFIGLGEMARVVADTPVRHNTFRGVFCSCGKQMNECLYWSKAIDRLESYNSSTFPERYEILLKTFDDVFGPDSIPVDSSKYLPNLSRLTDDLELDIKVLYVIKDVRNYTISQIYTIRRYKETNLVRKYVKGNSYFFFWKWYILNKKMQNFFSEKKIEVLQVGYEELCLYPKNMLQKICDFLDEEPETSMLNPNVSGSHSVLGNRMRNQTNKLEILYDNRWFLHNEWKFPALLFLHIMEYNNKHVYRNNMHGVWRQ